jgi:predicted histidine transporter YuiF (NhaC family)
MDGKIIGFYTKINKDGKEKKYDKKASNFTTIALIFCILIIIGLVIFIFFYFRRRQFKKRNANELDDDFSYIPKNDKITKLINGIEN